MNRFLSTFKTTILIAFMMLSIKAAATTLVSFSISELTQRAEYVFDGEVIAVHAQRSGSRGMVSTFVTFRIIETIKGQANKESLELKFLGGNIDGEVLEVNGSRIPELGERGVYFVESLDRDLINPLLGWSQGQYLIEGDSGSEQVTSVEAKPIVGVSPANDSMTALPSNTRARTAAPLLIATDPNIAEGISAVEPGRATGLSPAEFKQRIRALLP